MRGLKACVGLACLAIGAYLLTRIILHGLEATTTTVGSAVGLLALGAGLCVPRRIETVREACERVHRDRARLRGHE